MGFMMKLYVLLVIGGMALYGQAPSATLAGLVQDEQEGRLTAAKLVLRDTGRGTSRETVTDGNGGFLFTPLSPGTYELMVEQTGFAVTRFEALELRANEERSLRVKLKVATRGESVTVTEEAGLVREGMAVATSVDRGFIANQPLNGRTFQSLIHLSPGVVFVPASLPEQGQFSVNGQRPGTNYFAVDGVGANFGLPFATTPYEGAGGGTPSLSAQGSTSALASVDAVQEFTIQTSTYAPEYGRQPGAQVAIVTRSGTNQLHGSAFEYLRNDKLDANSWFGNYNRLKRPALRQNDFGFTLGGPVLIPGVYNGKNRTFFFASYEGLRLIQPVISPVSQVPSLEAREKATGMVKSLLDAYPLPVAAPLAAAPLETPYVAGFSNPSRLNATGARLDHAFSQRVSVFGRFQYAPSENRERGRYATPSFVAVLPAKTETVTVGSTMVLTSALTNDLRFNWSRSLAAQIYEQDAFGGAKILPRDILFPSFADPATSLYYLSIGGNDENTISPGTFSRNTQRQWNVVNTASWNRGTHALKFGVDWRRLAPSIGGRNFAKTLTVPTITQLTTGIVPSAEVRQVDSYLEPRYTNFSAFVQDAWRAGRRFTVTYGLRWEVNPAPGEANGNLPLTLTGIENPPTARLAERGTKLYETRYRNFAPRAGISWQPWQGRDTVIRAGLGWFFDLGYAFTGTAFTATNYPFSRARTASNISLSDPLLFAAVGPLSLNPPYPRLFDYYDDYRLPYTRQYSVAVEEPLGRTSSLSVSYVGAAGRRQSRVESLRPATLQNPLFTRVDAVSNGAYSDYHSLQTQLRRRMSRGLQALVSHTWAKSLDTSSDESIVNLLGPLSRGNVALDRGPSSFDIRHVFTGAASYELPRIGNRAARAIFGGFAFDSMVRLRGATPVTVVTGRDPLGLGLTNVARPDVVAGRPLYLVGEGYAGGRVFNPAAFDGASPLAQARQGTLGRGVMRGFALRQVDLSVRRRFTLSEGIGLDFRADAFNLFNTANFANPIGVMTNANFGRSTQIVSTSSVNGLNPLFQVGGPRSVQLSLKLQF
ncbi:MAG: carboxypeptidase regulatory-like domain-containing protein [Acidobacteria bacterium]|nr:carboxypeptidase regulatory-like domain-containing protein [Acidobacteriota bacterium]